MKRLTEKQKHILRQKLCDMKNRCYNPNNKFYKDYGGRGITVCDEWMDKKYGHSNFQRWALENGWKEFLSIDRVDVNGNYEPSNCRWATKKEQANNRRNNVYVTIHGTTKTAQEWSEQIGISERAFLSRVDYGWSEDRLLEPKSKPLKMTKAEMSKEIKYWRSLEEQGLLIRLPCKVGDKVYVTERRVIKCKIKSIEFFECGISIKLMYAGENELLEHWKTSVTIDEFGEKVFLTKEEAEQALERRKNG